MEHMEFFHIKFFFEHMYKVRKIYLQMSICFSPFSIINYSILVYNVNFYYVQYGYQFYYKEGSNSGKHSPTKMHGFVENAMEQLQNDQYYAFYEH